MRKNLRRVLDRLRSAANGVRKPASIRSGLQEPQQMSPQG